MIIVTITRILILITAISILFLRCWVRQNPVEAIMLLQKKEKPAWGLFLGSLIILDALGIILSAIWFLFFYL